MSTAAEILDAVKQLSPAQKRELVHLLESVLVEPGVGRAAGEAKDYLSRFVTETRPGPPAATEERPCPWHRGVGLSHHETDAR
jgi:hypothetical protein